MILHTFLLVASLLPTQIRFAGDDGPDLARAEALYERARYDEALGALGESCNGSTDPVLCGQLRALVHIALGQTERARQAFYTILARDIDSLLGNDFSPKVQRMFGEARQDLLVLQDLELAPPAPITPEGILRLEAKAPEGVVIEMLTLHLRLPGKREFRAITMENQGAVWFIKLPTKISQGQATAHYFLQVALGSGVEVPIGNEHDPFALMLRSEQPEIDSVNPLLKAPPPEKSEALLLGLPKWALWTIGGVGAALTAGALWYALTPNDPGTGNIQVNFQYTDLLLNDGLQLQHWQRSMDHGGK